MSRALRVEFPGAIYHAMARGVARMPVFQDDNDRIALLCEVEAQVRNGALIVHCLCLMVNHVHFLCETPGGGMGGIMHDILGNDASSFNRRHNRVGHLWQGRYKAILVQDGSYLLECSRYIHLNPYRAGIDTSGDLYPWSSYPNFLGEATVVPWVCTDRILGHFDSRDGYRAYVEAGKKRVINPFDVAVAGIAYGDAEFVGQIRRRALKAQAPCEQPAFRLLQRTVASPAIEDIRTAVDAAFADSSACQRRRFLVWALHTHTWLKGCEIARAAGLKRSAVSAVLRSIEQRSMEDSRLAERFSSLAEQLRSLQPDDVDQPWRTVPALSDL